MLLIPEDVYKQLLTSSSKAQPSQSNPQKPHQTMKLSKLLKTTNLRSAAKHNVLGEGDLEDLPIDETQQRLATLMKRKGMSDEAKNINYQQDFKRLNQLVTNKLERPIKVKAIGQNSSLPQATQFSSHPSTYKSSTLRSSRSTSAASSHSSISHEQRVQNILDYLKVDPNQFSLNSNLEVLAGRRGSPLKNTSAKRIVEYMLADFPVERRPPGYHIFIKKVMKDDYLKHQLLSQEERDMYRKVTGIGRGAITSGIKKKRLVQFKPKLW